MQMIYRVLLTALVLLFSFSVGAVEAPLGQARISADQVLRGRFTEENTVKGMDAPLHSSGHFIATASRGLIWALEKPFPTSTVVTPTEAIQDIGGMVVKLPVKNLHHLYSMISSALAGDWRGLDKDFAITPGGNVAHWQMLLTPRPGSPSFPYSSITVSGGRFVENIVMLKADGNSVALTFADETLSLEPLDALETALFNEVK